MMKHLPTVCLAAFLALQTRAIELDLVTTNITMPTGRTFQMPLSGTNGGGGPLKFAVVSIKPTKLTGTITPSTNRSLVLNVSGVDSNNTPFTGDLVLQLYEDLVTNTTARIIDLVNSNFYNGLTFHRVIQDFVCQGGDPNGNGTGGSGVTFDDEFVATLTFTGFGQLAMANSGDDSNDSQFFITDGDLSLASSTKRPPQHLNFSHTIFGQMTRGFDVLEKLMSTATDSNDAPLTPVIINTATVTSDTQDSVLRLAAVAGFTGGVDVVVSVMNTNKQAAQQTIHVNVITNSVNNPPFFGPIPALLTITQGQAVTFPLIVTDLEDDSVHLHLTDTDTGMFPTNLTASIDGFGNTWFVPDLTVTGAVHLLLGVNDNAFGAGADDDTQHFTMNIIPRSSSPTLNIVPTSGSLTVSTNALASKMKIGGTFSPTHTFTNLDIIVVSIGDPANPFTFTNAPPDTSRSVKKGTIKLKSPKGSVPAISAQFNGVKGTFKISVSGFDFPTPPTNAVEVSVMIGPDYGSDIRTWIQKKPGVYAPPPLP